MGKKMKTKKREIDKLVRDTANWWEQTLIVMKKKKIRTWQAVFILAFVSGFFISLILLVDQNIQTTSKAAGETATLALSVSRGSIVLGETVSVEVILNTQSSSVVVAKAMLSYNPTEFELQSVNTASGIFGIAECSGTNPTSICSIIQRDAINGKVGITVAKPTPGLSTSAGNVATLVFKSLKVNSLGTGQDNLKLSFVAVGSYEDSDVILDDGLGTDILASVANATVNITPQVCSSFTYNCEDCQIDNTKSCTVATSIPTGCIGGSPQLVQSCIYNAPVCTVFTYSGWTLCSKGVQTRTVKTKLPDGCDGGNPILSRTCKMGKIGDIQKIKDNPKLH